MSTRTPQELRHMANRFREMAIAGDDAQLRAALIQLADEFEREAEEDEDSKPTEAK